MAKLKKPFGRQIAKLKAEAAATVGSKDKDALAKAANQLAKDTGFDYVFTADSFTKKRKKRGRSKQEKGSVSPAPQRNGTTFSAKEIMKAREFLQAVDVKKAKALLDLLG